eukprot:g5367.t1
MSNCLNCGKVNPPSKGSRKRKYCSHKCATGYLHELQRRKHPRYNDPTWKQSSKKALKIKQNKYDQTIGAGLIPVEEAVVILQVKSPGPLHSSNIPRRKINGRWWFDPQDVKELKNQRDEEKIKIQEDIKMRQNKLFSNPIKGNESYELRRKQLFQCNPPKWVQKSPKALKYWNSQSIPWEEEKKGNILTLDCDACGETKDYKDFRVAPGKTSDGRWCRHKLCKPCVKKKFPRKNRKQEPKNSFCTRFANSIHQSLIKRHGSYFQLSYKVIWESLDYSKDELRQCIESKFTPWMSFENNLKPKEGVKTWQLDHIVPKSTFEYTSMDDEGFKQAWALDNLQPLESTINQIKSDKKLRVAMNNSFRRGIQSVLENKTPLGKSSIWKFLDYTPSDAVNHVKSKFDKKMSWENWGDVWQLDHVVPQAYLSYTDPYSDNFKQCWKLSNLRPLLFIEKLEETKQIINSIQENIRMNKDDRNIPLFPIHFDTPKKLENEANWKTQWFTEASEKEDEETRRVREIRMRDFGNRTDIDWYDDRLELFMYQHKNNATTLAKKFMKKSGLWLDENENDSKSSFESLSKDSNASYLNETERRKIDPDGFDPLHWNITTFDDVYPNEMTEKDRLRRYYNIYGEGAELPKEIQGGSSLLSGPYSPRLIIDQGPGDASIFKGHKMFHTRHRPAGVNLLYIKMAYLGLNEFSNDPVVFGPLVENPKQMTLPPSKTDIIFKINPTYGLRAFRSFESAIQVQRETKNVVRVMWLAPEYAKQRFVPKPSFQPSSEGNDTTIDINHWIKQHAGAWEDSKNKFYYSPTQKKKFGKTTKIDSMFDLYKNNIDPYNVWSFLRMTSSKGVRKSFQRKNSNIVEKVYFTAWQNATFEIERRRATGANDVATLQYLEERKRLNLRHTNLKIEKDNKLMEEVWKTGIDDARNSVLSFQRGQSIFSPVHEPIPIGGRLPLNSDIEKLIGGKLPLQLRPLHYTNICLENWNFLKQIDGKKTFHQIEKEFGFGYSCFVELYEVIKLFVYEGVLEIV